VNRFSRLLALFAVCLLVGTPVLTLAQATGTEAEATDGSLKQDIDTLNEQVKQKQKKIKDLNASIENYKSKIEDQQKSVLSLQNELALLENRIEEKALSTQRTRQQIELANLEIQSVSNEIQLEQNTINRRETVLAELVRQIEQGDQVSVVDAFIARPSLSEFFSHLDEIKRVENDLTEATRTVKESKLILEEKKRQLEEGRTDLQAKKDDLLKEQEELEANRSAKVSLVAETQDQESEFQRIMYELRQQQQSESNDAASLQDKLKDKLDSVDVALAKGDILLSWPIKASKGISAHFHDPSYPFKKLFEHPGVDLPTPVGTPVKAAAGGYIAWLKTGKQYGNYIMVVHPGGVATVYAHLSKFGVKADTYVERGDVIGYSGGKPGDPGAGLSTGAHLHFEVRVNGIPVNPENYLPSLD
jgi:murein DD-endopeptidase MepM/ murein hydrolase activator NlpD